MTYLLPYLVVRVFVWFFQAWNDVCFSFPCFRGTDPAPSPYSAGEHCTHNLFKNQQNNINLHWFEDSSRTLPWSFFKILLSSSNFFYFSLIFFFTVFTTILYKLIPQDIKMVPIKKICMVCYLINWGGEIRCLR